jgi:hypothetical protein
MSTIIDILSKGNLELFHSSFLAWLMDKSNKEHGLGSIFLTRLLSKFFPDDVSQAISKSDYEVLTEYKESGCRFDILVKVAIPEKRGIVFENKVKGFGSLLQLDAYKKKGYDVIALAYLPETIEEVAKGKYPLITYSEIVDILKTLPLNRDNKYHLFIEEWVTHMENNLLIFDNFRNYINSKIDFKLFYVNISDSLNNMKLMDNDIRTLNYFYFYNLDQFIKINNPELAFGNLGYEEAEKINGNTSWQYEKNMQGIPFMEALLHNPFSPDLKYRMHSIFETIYKKERFVIAPRVELWLDLKQLLKEVDKDVSPENKIAGLIMLGSFKSTALKDIFRTQPPYNTELRKRGPRNDHYETVTYSELPCSRFVARLKKMLSLVGDFV